MNELALTERESRRFRVLEEGIRQSAGTMYENLKAIHDEKLYRAEFKTWEEYCEKRWNMSHRNANRLIEHGRVLALLSDETVQKSAENGKRDPMGPISERVTREVAGLPDKEKVRVIAAVAEESKARNNGKPKVTATAVRAKVEELSPSVESIVCDELERPVPAHLLQHHEAAAQIKSAASKLDAVKKLVSELHDLAGGVFLPLQQIEIALKDVKGLISHSRYWTECPRCKGKPKANCDRCDGHGFLPFSRRGTLSAEDKAWLGIEES